MAVEADCPICESSRQAKETFAVAKVADHFKAEARHDDHHQAWIDEHTENGSLAESRAARSEPDQPRQPG